MSDSRCTESWPVNRTALYPGLALVHRCQTQKIFGSARGDETRVISFRGASREEGETYRAWLEEDQ